MSGNQKGLYLECKEDMAATPNQTDCFHCSCCSKRLHIIMVKDDPGRIEGLFACSLCLFSLAKRVKVALFTVAKHFLL